MLSLLQLQPQERLQVRLYKQWHLYMTGNTLTGLEMIIWCIALVKSLMPKVHQKIIWVCKFLCIGYLGCNLQTSGGVVMFKSNPIGSMEGFAKVKWVANHMGRWICGSIVLRINIFIGVIVNANGMTARMNTVSWCESNGWKKWSFEQDPWQLPSFVLPPTAEHAMLWSCTDLGNCPWIHIFLKGFRK